MTEVELSLTVNFPSEFNPDAIIKASHEVQVKFMELADAINKANGALYGVLAGNIQSQVLHEEYDAKKASEKLTFPSPKFDSYGMPVQNSYMKHLLSDTHALKTNTFDYWFNGENSATYSSDYWAKEEALIKKFYAGDQPTPTVQPPKKALVSATLIPRDEAKKLYNSGTPIAFVLMEKTDGCDFEVSIAKTSFLVKTDLSFIELEATRMKPGKVLGYLKEQQ